MPPDDPSNEPAPQESDTTPPEPVTKKPSKKRKRKLNKVEARMLGEYYEVAHDLCAEGQQLKDISEALQEKYPNSNWKEYQVRRRMKQQKKNTLPKRSG